ncbi:MAG: hypothetical protein NVSMB5_17170 [Candidatus Velthaea sp.]
MVEWDFDARDAQAAQRARNELVAYIGRECSNADASSAELVLGELIGNVARYAPGPTHIEATVNDSRLTIEVRDTGHGFERTAVHSAQDNALMERGRGLLIVETLSDEFDVHCPQNEGCRVRARLTVREAT